MKKPKIAILYISLGSYHIFWENFFKSCEKNFCIDIDKEYFIFSDNPKKIKPLSERINIYRQDNLGWPCTTLMRYHMFLRLKDILNKYNYICYFNANTVFIDSISSCEFFGNDQNELVGGLHPGYKNQSKEKYPFEKRKSSKAFTMESNYYFQGCINGGQAKSFLSAIEEIKSNIDKDLGNGIIALWHDESHWNFYLNKKIKENSASVKILDCNYLWPEEFKNNNDLKIIMRDKKLFGGHARLRGIEINRNDRMIKFLTNIKLKLKNLH
tara:strand:- start:2533 stop:3339 length:807 start_codon:yes stop_codon:yes gene_type:complete